MTRADLDRHTVASLFDLAAVSFAVLRPHLLIPAWACAATGASCAARFGGAALDLSSRSVPLAAFGWSSALVSIHIVNLLADRQSDLINRKNLFWRWRLKSVQLKVAAAVAAALALLATGGVCLSSLHRTGSPVTTATPATIILMTLMLGAAYNLRPLRLSNRWGWDLVANALGYGLLAPWFGIALLDGSADIRPAIITASGLLIPCVGAVFLWTAILDRKGDTAAGKQSWAVRWGPQNGFPLAVVLAGLALVATVWSAASMPETGANADQATTLQLCLWRAGLVGGPCCLSILGWRLWRASTAPRDLRHAITAAVAAVSLPGLVHWPFLAAVWGIWYGMWRLAVRRALSRSHDASRLPDVRSYGPHSPSTAPSDQANRDLQDR